MRVVPEWRGGARWKERWGPEWIGARPGRGKKGAGLGGQLAWGIKYRYDNRT